VKSLRGEIIRILMTAGLMGLRAGTDLTMGWKHYRVDTPLVQSMLRAVSQIHEHIQLCCHTEPIVERAFLDPPILSCHITLRMPISVSRSAIESREDVARSDTGPLPRGWTTSLKFFFRQQRFPNSISDPMCRLFKILAPLPEYTPLSLYTACGCHERV
jgi:hypothetical protein